MPVLTHMCTHVCTQSNPVTGIMSGRKGWYVVFVSICSISEAVKNQTLFSSVNIMTFFFFNGVSLGLVNHTPGQAPFPEMANTK